MPQIQSNSEVQEYLDKLRETVQFLQDKLGAAPATAVVAGSGLGGFLKEPLIGEELPYREVPYFPPPTVEGHPGKMGVGKHAGVRFCALVGRVHAYEGIPLSDVVFSVRALGMWGVKNFILTNAAGAINSDFKPGEFMLIKDHINLLGDNPLCGPNLDSLGERFPGMTEAYSRSFNRLAHDCARDTGVSMWQGVYAAVKGPSYETPAEILMLRTIGADAVGMSTVPEVIALNHMNRKVMGLSCITNMAAGTLSEVTNHRDVMRVANSVQEDFGKLILEIVGRIG